MCFSVAYATLQELASILNCPSAITKLDFCSTEGAVWLLHFCFYPLHDAVLMEYVLAGRLSNNRARFKVLHTDSTTVLLFLDLASRILHLFQLL